MALLGELQVNLTANSKKLTAGLKKGAKQVKGFAAKIKKLGKSIGGLGIAFGSAAAVAGLRSFVSSQLELVDALGKTSRRLGLSTEALGAYQHAAGLSGLETSELTVALERMQDTIGAALLGEAGASKAIESLGLGIKELANADDPLERIGKALQGIGNQNQKLALVRDIFGRSGAKVLNLYEQDLASVREEFVKLGGSIDEHGAKSVEDFNDQMLKLSTQLTAVGRSELIKALPGISNAVGNIAASVTTIKDALSFEGFNIRSNSLISILNTLNDTQQLLATGRVPQSLVRQGIEQAQPSHLN